MSQINWIHCNMCFSQFSVQAKFYFLSCYHVACHQCMTKAGTGGGPKCPRCKKSVEYKEISNKMEKQFLDYFNPGIWSHLGNTNEKITYQNKQIFRWIEHMNQNDAKYEKYLKFSEDLNRKFETSKALYLKLRSERIALQESHRTNNVITFQGTNKSSSQQRSSLSSQRNMFDFSTPDMNIIGNSGRTTSSNASITPQSSRNSAESFFQNRTPRSKMEYGSGLGKNSAFFIPNGR